MVLVLKGRWSRGGVLFDAASYSFERTIRLALTAAVGVLIARYLGPDGLGLLSYAFSVFVLLGPLSLLGMRAVLVREFSTRDNWQVVLASALGRQLPIAAVGSVLGFVLISTTRSFERDAVLIALALLPLPVLGTADTLRAMFEATGRVRLIVVSGLAAIGVASVVRIVAVLLGAPIWVFAVAGTLDATVMTLGLLLGVRGRKTLRAAAKQFRSDVARDLLRESWPLLIAGFAILLYMRADIVMLGLLADDETTGIYVAAARFSELWYFLPTAAMAAARPRLARLFADGELEAYRGATQRFMTTSLAVSVGAIVVTLLVGGFLIETVYGSDFSAASVVLRIHIMAAPFVFLGVAASQWFIDRGMTREVMLRSILGAVANIVLNLILIPSYGATGVAIATLVSYALASVLINAFFPSTRAVFVMQIRSLRLAWR